MRLPSTSTIDCVLFGLGISPFPSRILIHLERRIYEVTIIILMFESTANIYHENALASECLALRKHFSHFSSSHFPLNRSLTSLHMTRVYSSVTQSSEG